MPLTNGTLVLQLLSFRLYFSIGEESSKAALEKAKKSAAYVKIVSPWEQAMKGNEELLATMKSQMAGPCSQNELCKYKCFNRCSCIL